MFKFASLFAIASLVMLSGCATTQTAAPGADIHDAVCVLIPTQSNQVAGVIRFTDVPGGVRVQAAVHGLAPDTSHGFHIHEFGDIDCPDGTCTGGHYDPQQTGHHALPGDPTPHHAGDMGNLTANADGIAIYNEVIPNLTVADAKNPIIGRAVIVHAKPDDGGQPTGNAGARIAAGVIGVGK